MTLLTAAAGCFLDPDDDPAGDPAAVHAPQMGPLPYLVRLNLCRTEAPLPIVNEGQGPLSWTASTDRPWLTVRPAAGATLATDTLTLSVDRDGLAAGRHWAHVAVASDGGDGTTTVEIRVTDEPAFTYRVVDRFAHDPGAFTQGLLFHEGALYESTGLEGRSSLRRVDPATGEVLQRRDLPADVFGEGLALWETTLVQLTWQDHVAYRWGLRSFAPLGTFGYPTEGWGLTTDDTRLIMSDGGARLFFRDPATFAQSGQVPVTDSLGEVIRLNELEWIDGEVWANVWLTDYVARIDPATGAVTGWIDLSGLLTAAEAQAANVLNGLAWDAAGGRLFVTGKYWPWLFEVQILAAGGAEGAATEP